MNAVLYYHVVHSVQELQTKKMLWVMAHLVYCDWNGNFKGAHILVIAYKTLHWRIYTYILAYFLRISFRIVGLFRISFRFFVFFTKIRIFLHML